MFFRIKDTIVDSDSIASMYIGSRHFIGIGITLKNGETTEPVLIDFPNVKEATEAFEKIQKKLDAEVIA